MKPIALLPACGEKVAEGRMRGGPSPRTRGEGVLAVLLVSLVLAMPASAATEKRLDQPERKEARAADAKVNLDVKDAEVAVILKDLKKQCGIRNLMIDPNVEGKGTFYFRDVPCRQAFSVVLRSLGLDAVSYSNSVVMVGRRKD